MYAGSKYESHYTVWTAWISIRVRVRVRVYFILKNFDGVVGTTKHSAALSTEHLPHTNITITTGSEHWKQAEEHSTLVTCLEQAVALDLYRPLVHQVPVCTTLHLDHSTLTDVLKSEGRQP